MSQAGETQLGSVLHVYSQQHCHDQHCHDQHVNALRNHVLAINCLASGNYSTLRSTVTQPFV